MNKYLTHLALLIFATSLANAFPKADLTIDPQDTFGDCLIATLNADTSKMDDTHSLNEAKDVKIPVNKDSQNLLTQKMKQEFLQREILNAMIEPISFTN